ncbi:MAG: NAD(P)-dependent oxidoreductase [Candidatus ainarchaeum sp.]|nr:NAD(P)-dependent oxidoreductase [Candidatus ainarchaeum sp.]
MKYKKIMVTGSNGFLGREVVKKLKEKNYKVIEFDISNGLDILDKKQLSKKLACVDAVIHLAGIIENTNPNLYDINVTGTKNLIECAIEEKVKKIVFLSSTAVYGFTKGQIDEETEINPENEYEKSKVEGEKLLFKNSKKIEFNIIRSAMIFGPNDYWRSMFKLLKKNFPLTSNGLNKFQIIYVLNLANLIIKILENGKNNEIYLASDKEKISLIDFCRIVKKKLTGKENVRTIPTFIALIIGKITGKKIINKENIRHISKERNYNTNKIKKIGYVQEYSQESAINETIKELNL